MKSLSNPDARPLPPGWHQHFDTEQQSWYYVQINVLPPKVSYTHPASLTPAPSRSSTPVPVLELEPIESSTEASAGSNSSFIHYTAVSAKLSTAQQLYASAINKRTIRSSSPGLESWTAKTPRLSPPSVPLAQRHASMSPPMHLFPDPSKNAQPAGPTELYNRTVASQQGGVIPSPLRNLDSRQTQPFDPSTRRSQSVQLPPPPQNGPHQPQRASTEATSQLDLVNRNNTNVVVTRPTRMGETPTIAMIARPPSVDRRNHPDTLTSPPLYASSGPSRRYGTSSASLPPASSLLTPPNSPPTYYESGGNRQTPSPDQSQQQYSAGLTVSNQPPGVQQRTVASPQTYFGGQAPSQYAAYQYQLTQHQQLNQNRTPTGIQQQGTSPGPQIPPPPPQLNQAPTAFQQRGYSDQQIPPQQWNQSSTPMAFQQQPGTQISSQQLNQSQAPATFQPHSTTLGHQIPQQLNQSQAPMGFQQHGIITGQQLPLQPSGQSQAPSGIQQQGTILGQQTPHQQLNQSHAPMGFQQQGATPSQQIPSQQSSQSQVTTAFQQQGTVPGGQEYAPQYSQSSTQVQPRPVGQPSPPHQLPQNHPPPVTLNVVPPAPLRQTQAYGNTLQQHPPPQAQQTARQMAPLQPVQSLAPSIGPQASSGSAQFVGHTPQLQHYPPNQPAATMIQYQTYGKQPLTYQAQAQLQSPPPPPPPPPPQQFSISGPRHNTYDGQQANMNRQLVRVGSHQPQPQPHSLLQQIEEQLVVGFVRGLTGAGHHGAHHNRPAQQGLYLWQDPSQDPSQNYVIDPSFDDTWSDSNDQFTYTDTQVDVYDTWTDGLGDSFTSLSIDN